MNKEKIIFRKTVAYKDRYTNERAVSLFIRDDALSLLLDSSLIFQSDKKRVDIKFIDCGSYKQVYFYKKPFLMKDKNVEKMKDSGILIENLEHVVKINDPPELKQIAMKNLLRSRFEMERLVKCNIEEWKTFVTLTFADNIKSIEEANKQFNTWRTYIKQLKSDFKCVGVPEFQKRGAVHYHLLTNINYNDFDLLSQEEVKIYNKKSGWQIGRTIKGWNKGYSMCKNMCDINVIGYLTKYMTKDIDNRLWGKRRYFYTHNLKKPCKFTLDLSNVEDFALFTNLLSNDYKEEYSNSYIDFLQREVSFVEYKKG